MLTSLRGRGPQTLRRAAAAKMQDADDEAIARASVILSILPPAEALVLAERFTVPLSRVQRKAIFVDFNAVNVETVLRISSIIEPTGASFVDGSIIGPTPGVVGVTNQIRLAPAEAAWPQSNPHYAAPDLAALPTRSELSPERAVQDEKDHGR